MGSYSLVLQESTPEHASYLGKKESERKREGEREGPMEGERERKKTRERERERDREVQREKEESERPLIYPNPVTSERICEWPRWASSQHREP